MEKFSTIYQRACDRKLGQQALQGLLPENRTKQSLVRTKDDRWLAQMTRCIFQAGFVWRVVDQKWEGFETLFFGFPPERILMLSPDQIDKFAQDKRIIRNRQKVLSVQHNAQFICDIAREHGSFGKFVAHWPSEDLVGLFSVLKKRGSRLGGMSGQRLLRNMGKDTFVVTADVVRCLLRAGLEINSNPSSQRDYKMIQQCFNNWHQECGLPYSHISKICAYSIDTD